MKYKDTFGFLDLKESFDFAEGKIVFLDEFDEGRKWIRDYENDDGFLYLPTVETVKHDHQGQEKAVPNSTRPALLHKLPASHSISLNLKNDRDSIRKSDSGFTIHLLGYIYGTRVQFSDWWHDGRISIKSTHNIYIKHSTAEDYLAKSYEKYKTLKEEYKTWFVNVLIMHSRASSYEWDWESFTIEYMVFDGLYRLFSEIFNKRAKGHKDRFRIVFDQFGIATNDDLVDCIYSLRNDLFHQGLWDKGQPCTGSSSDAFSAQYNLARINNRLIPALLGYQNDYVRSPWWSISKQTFDAE